MGKPKTIRIPDAPRRLAWKADALSCAFLVVLSLLFLYQVAFQGKVLLPADLLLLMPPWKAHARQMFPDFHRVYNPMLDVIQQYYPWRLFAAEWMRQDVLPLWNPHMFAGTSFVANGQSAIFYPLNVLFYLMPVKFAFGWTAILHLALIGVGTFGFLRCILRDRVAAVVGATTFMFCGFISAWLEFTTFLCTATWLPTTLYFFERSLPRRENSALLFRFYSGMALTGIALGMSLLAGHLQIGFYVWLTFFAYALFRLSSFALAARRREWGSAASVSWLIGGVALAMAIGLAIGAPQWLPVVELTRFNTRAGEFDLKSIWGARLPLKHLLTFLVPNFFGNPVDYNYWGSFNYIELSGSIGVAALVLWIPALVKLLPGEGAYCGQVVFWLVLLLLGLSLAMLTPVYYLFVWCIPGFGQLRGPARALLIIDFAGAVLAAHGVEALLTEMKGETRRVLSRSILFIAGLGTALVLAGVLCFSQEFLSDYFFAYGMRQLVLFAVFLMAAVALVQWSLGKVGRRPLPVYLLPLLVATESFVANFRFNPQLDARSVYFPTDAHRFLQKDRSLFRVLSIGENFINWLPSNAPMALGLEDIQGSDSLWTAAYANYLSDIQPGAPTYAWKNYRSPRLDDLNVKYVLVPPGMNLNPPPGELVFDGDLRIYRRPHAKPRCYLDTFSTVQVLRPDPNRLEVMIGSDLTIRGTLYWSNASYPGWRAFVNGQPTKMEKQSEVIQKVSLPPRSRRVSYFFYPLSVKVGIFMMCLALAVCGFCWTLPQERKRRTDG